MDDGTAPAPKPDMMEQAGDLMKRFAKGEAISGTLYSDRNAAIVLASAILAVAGELRGIHNMLADVRDSNRSIGDSLAALVAELKADDGAEVSW
jgi:hypothetical protein